MSMTELERCLVSCMEEIQQEFRVVKEIQGKKLADFQLRQEDQEKKIERLMILLKDLNPLLHQLNNMLKNEMCTKRNR